MVLVQNFCFFFLLLLIVKGKPLVKNLNVMEFGATADGKTECSQAFLKAWQTGCAWKGGAKVFIPQGNFLVNPTTFEGKCKGFMEFHIQGTVKAPNNINLTDKFWIRFTHIDGLYVHGKGTFDGDGTFAWEHNNCKKNLNCQQFPPNLRFDYVTDATVHKIHSVNSKQVHINIFASANINLNSITIKALPESPNTDGIHIGDSKFVTISHSTISTGDDCISFGSGSKNIHVSDITCGPGHGISIGSLGRYPNEDDVMGLIVRNITFIGTTNGARIKTWASSNVNHVQNITFEDLIMKDVENPIIIDQSYCPNNLCASKDSSVSIKDVHYKNIHGTSTSKVAIRFSCSGSYPCQGIELNDIYLTKGNNEEPTLENCLNVNGIAIGKQTPPCCFH